MTPPASEEDMEAMALSRLSRVVGGETARRVFAETLQAIGLAKLVTPDDLYLFAGVLSNRGGFEGAVGGLLAVTAVMRGAAGKR